MNYKGSLYLLILNSLSHGPKHGYGIAKEIKRQSQGVLDFKEGTIYPTLHNMESDGLVEVFEKEIRGRIRRYYHLTETGRSRLQQERQAWQSYSGAVNQVLDEGSV